MAGPISWIKSRVGQAFDKAFVNFLAGVFVTLIAVVLGAGFFSSPLIELRVPLVLLVVLSLFALIGVLFVGEALWDSVTLAKRSEYEPYLRDDELEGATGNLLDQLARVEVGLEIHTDPGVLKFSSALVSLFDQWEAAMLPYSSELDKGKMEEIRGEILGQHLPHGGNKAKEWVRVIKELTNKAREQVGKAK